MKFDDTIFVMEDVDAASNIVHSRAPANTTKTTVTVTTDEKVQPQKKKPMD
jgi:hypothetical protein